MIKGDVPLRDEELDYPKLKDIKTVQHRMARDKEGDPLADLRRFSGWREKRLLARCCARVVVMNTFIEPSHQ